MFNHAPDDYDCPFCRLVAGESDELTAQDDIVLRREHALAFVASYWWPNNRGHVIARASYAHRTDAWLRARPGFPETNRHLLASTFRKPPHSGSRTSPARSCKHPAHPATRA